MQSADASTMVSSHGRLIIDLPMASIGKALLSMAVYFGKTRLIDNFVIG